MVFRLPFLPLKMTFQLKFPGGDYAVDDDDDDDDDDDADNNKCKKNGSPTNFPGFFYDLAFATLIFKEPTDFEIVPATEDR